MPMLIFDDREELVAVSADPIWQEDDAVLKDGFLDGNRVFILYDPQTDGSVFAEDSRFEGGLHTGMKGLSNVRFTFLEDGRPLPKPLLHFVPQQNAGFMKYMLHNVRKSSSH